MLWLVLALIGALAESTRDLFSKRSLQNLNEYAVAFYRCFFSSLCSAPLLIFTGIPDLDSVFWLVILCSGGLYAAASILYMRAIKSSPLSLTVPMLAFTPLFLIITSPFMLGELPSYFGLVGIILIVFGTYILSLRDLSEGYFAPFRAILREKGSLIMLFNAIIFSIGSNLIKIGVQHSNPIFFLILSNAFMSVLLFPTLLFKSKNIANEFRSNFAGLLKIGVFHAIMAILVFKAMELTIVSYAISVKRTSIVFSTLYGYFFFNEKRIAERLSGTLVIIVGVLLTTLF